MNVKAFPEYDGVAHAIYVEAQHPVDSRAKNWYCFMITNCPEENLECSGATNLCENYCRVARSNPFSSSAIDYIPGDSSSKFTPISYGIEYGFVSNNDISCPLIHFYDPDSITSAGNVIRLANYDMVDGSFDLTSVSFPTTPLVNGNLPSSALFRSVTIKACLAGKTDTESAFEVFIYKKDCTEAAYIDYT